MRAVTSSISHSSLSPYVTPLGQNLWAQKVAATMDPRKTRDVLTSDSRLTEAEAEGPEDDLDDDEGEPLRRRRGGDGEGLT